MPNEKKSTPLQMAIAKIEAVKSNVMNDYICAKDEESKNQNAILNMALSLAKNTLIDLLPSEEQFAEEMWDKGFERANDEPFETFFTPYKNGNNE